MTYRDFTIQGDYVERTKGIPTGSYETVFNNPGTFTSDGSNRLGVTYDHRFRTGLTLTGRVGYDDIYEDGEYVYDWAEEEGDPEDRMGRVGLGLQPLLPAVRRPGLRRAPAGCHPP